MDEKLKQKLYTGGMSLGVQLTETMLEQFGAYMDLLLKWNESMNLTAITDPAEVISKHFIDSLSLLSCDIKPNARVIDVGCGAGFPSLPLLIARGDLQIVMLDSQAKRLNFIKEVLKTLGLQAEQVRMRAEDGGRAQNYRETFDIATARAVANLSTLSEYCLPFVRKGGRFLAMKGDATEEINEAKGALLRLGAHVGDVKTVTYDEWTHTIVEIKKISTTPSKYPRKAGKPSKEPLK